MTSRRTTRVLNLAAAAALALVPLVALAPSASAAPAAATTTTTTAGVDAAVAALEGGESVYVDPAASDLISVTDAESLRQQVQSTGYPYYIAILPRSAAVGGSSSQTLDALFTGMGKKAGTYAVYLGDASTSAFKAGDTGASVSTIATVAYRDNKDQGAYAVISAFVTASAPVVSGSGTGGGGVPGGDGGVPGGGSGGVIDPGGSTDTGSGSGIPVLGVLAVGAVAVGGGAWYVSRKNKQANAERTAAVQKTVFEDVTAYGEAVATLDVDDPRLDDAGRADAQTALDAYETAKMKVATMARPEDAASVTTALEGGRFAMACVQARIEGRPLPERRPPCFVDPRHGPSVEDIEWAPDGGAARPIPVCQACAVTLRSGQLPRAREVEMAGQRVPYWAAGRSYAPYAGGYYSNSGMDLMSGIFIGSMLGGAFNHGPVYVDSGQGDAGSTWGGGGGDFGGGGGFGGGDFGGGGDF